MPDESTYEPELTEIEAMLRELEPADLALETPPNEIWDRIEAELGAELESTPSRDRTDDTNVVAAPFGRRRTWAAPLLAAAAAVVLVVAGMAVLNSGSATTIAEVDLAFDADAFDPLGADATAHASLVDDDGRQTIEIDDDTLPFELGEDADLELWLIQVDDAGIVDMVSLGNIDDDGDRSFAVPAGYDPDVYSVVDISIEPRDGDATHSGRSILRGTLEA